MQNFCVDTTTSPMLIQMTIAMIRVINKVVTTEAPFYPLGNKTLSLSILGYLFSLRISIVLKTPYKTLSLHAVLNAVDDVSRIGTAIS